MATHTQRGTAHAIRLALTGDRKKELMELMGWETGDVSRVLAGTQGIPLEKWDPLLDFIDHVPVSKPYLNAISTLCQVGAQCHCAREGFGECGARR